MTNHSVFYYTHNLLSANILEKTLTSCMESCKKNRCELILTSQYPLTFSYYNDKIFFDKVEETPIRQELEQLITKNLAIDYDNELICKPYVLGKMPYSIKTILEQLLFSCSMCEGKFVTLMEHDCLYPPNYLSVVENCLKKYEICHCLKNTCFASEYGFVKSLPHVYLSSFSFRKELFVKILKNKLDMLSKYGFTIVEPMSRVSVNDLSEGSFKDEECRNGVIGQEMFLDDLSSKCIDEDLGDGNDILEFVHGLNSSSIDIMFKYMFESGRSVVEHCKTTLFDNHVLWGASKQLQPL